MPGIDIILTMVPPGLSLSLSFGLIYSQSRLKRQKITAIKSEYINAAGRTKACLFDKTGTLTAEKVELDKVLIADEGCSRVIDLRGTRQQTATFDRLAECLALNHTLVNAEDPSKASGSSLELELKRYSLNLGIRDQDYEILNIFEFNPTLKRMTVVSRNLITRKTFALTKGAPEMVLGLCRLSSKAEKSLMADLQAFISNGKRVLAFAIREVEVNVSVDLNDPGLESRSFRAGHGFRWSSSFR